MGNYKIKENPWTGTYQWILDANILDWQDSVLDKDLTTPPVGPTEGDRYIIAAVATGVWAGHENDITEYTGGVWEFTTPNEGYCLQVEDEGMIYIYDGSAWANIGSAVDHAALVNRGWSVAGHTIDTDIDMDGNGFVETGDIFGTTASGDRGYVRIGDAGTTQHSLDSEDDLYVTGELEVKTNVYVDGVITLENGGIFANKQNTDIDTGTETVDSFADTLGTAVQWVYVVQNGVNIRSGTINACWEETGNSVEYTETRTQDIGNTSGVTFAVDIDTDNVRLRATVGTDNWSVKVVRILL